jgi:hypothetical protein
LPKNFSKKEKNFLLRQKKYFVRKRKIPVEGHHQGRDESERKMKAQEHRSKRIRIDLSHIERIYSDI